MSHQKGNVKKKLDKESVWDERMPLNILLSRKKRQLNTT